MASIALAVIWTSSIRGDLEQQLSSWATTANGQGRVRPLNNAYRGQLEVIQWQDLINDAWMRNRATLTAAGLSRNRSTAKMPKVENPIVDDEDEDLAEL